MQRRSSRRGGVEFLLALVLGLASLGMPTLVKAAGAGGAPPRDAAVSLIRAPRPSGAAEPQHALTITVRDENGIPTPVRLQVENLAGQSFGPLDPQVPYYTAYTGHNFFYSGGTGVAHVATGTIRVLVSKGFDYEPLDVTVDVFEDTALDLSLTRLFDTYAWGWIGADTHVHIDHGGEGDVYDISNYDLAEIARAEGLSLTCALTNGLYFTGQGFDVAGDPRHRIHFGMEYRSALFGHMGLLGLQSLINQGCCLPLDPPYPLNIETAQLARGQGATIVYSHPVSMPPDQFMEDGPEWPYSGFAREIAADVVLNGIDAMDVFSYSNYDNGAARDLWFDLLKLGYRLPLSVGTDTGVNRYFDPPVGGFRVYARPVASRGGYSLDAWLEALRGGNTFATNGPILWALSVNGNHPGDTVGLDPDVNTTLSANVVIKTREPLDFVEIYTRTGLHNRLPLPPHTTVLQHTFSFTVPDKDSWVVFRFIGTPHHPSTVGDRLEILTSPLYLRSSHGKSDPSPASVVKFKDWISDLQQLITERQGIGDPDIIEDALQTLHDAQSRLNGKAQGDEDDRRDDVIDAASTPEASEQTLQVDSSSRGDQVLFRTTGNGFAHLEVFDVRGRRVFQGPSERLPATLTWSGREPGGNALASGVYFVRILGGDGSAVTRRIVHLP